jgi:hypothetical protein
MTLTTYRDILDDMVRDTDSNISDAEFITALDIGTLRYSKDRPRNVVGSVVSDGTNFADLPTDWINGFSKLQDVRKLVDGGLAEWTEYELYNGVAAEQILLAIPLAVGETIYISFTYPHELDDTKTTIPEIDRIAVLYWAAAHLLDQLAVHYAGHKATLIQADAVDWQSKSRDFSARAKEMRKLYFDHMEIKQGKIAAAGTVVNLNLKTSQGKDHLTHKGKYR